MVKKIDNEQIPLQPPEPGYITEHHILRIDYDDPHLDDPWQLRLYAEKLIEHKIGDNVELTDLKVKQPNPLARGAARIFGKKPQVKLYLTINF